MTKSIAHLQALVKCVKCALLDQLNQKYSKCQALCQDRQKLPTWINAKTVPKKTDKMKHKQKNARTRCKTCATKPGYPVAHLLQPLQNTCHQRWNACCKLANTVPLETKGNKRNACCNCKTHATPHMQRTCHRLFN